MAKEIFKKFSDGVTRTEFKNFPPKSTLNLNSPNKRTTFAIDFNENFTTKNFEYKISGEVKKTNGDSYAAGTGIQLVHNFVSHLFTYIEVKKHNKIIDEVDHPGITSTVKQYINYTKGDNAAAEASGCDSIYQGGGKFHALGKLSDLGLGFFEDVDVQIFRGGFEISFTRNSDNDALYRYKTKKADGTENALPDEGKIIITDFYLRVPIIEYEDNSKIQLLKSLDELSSNDGYRFEYKTWQCVQHKSVKGKTLNFDITNVYRSVHNPLFAMVVFQTDKLNDQLEDTSEFDHMFVKNIHVEVNGKRYPEELTDLDFENKDGMIAYDMFRDYRRVFKGDENNCISYQEFINKRPVYVIDLTKQPESLSNMRSNIILHVDFSKNVDAPAATEGTICYVIIVSHKCLYYDMIKNMLKEN